VALAATAWYFLKSEDKNAGKAAQAPSASVTTVAAKRMDVPVRLEANGYVSSLNSVDVRPQVSNLIAKVHIKEGQFVKAGDILFTLDDRADRVNLQKAEAQLAKDQASLADVERQLARSRELLGKGFIAQSAVDTVQTQVEAARATVRADQAAVEAARVTLGYDTIRAPSAGRAGAIPVYAGSLVQPNTTPLVTISQLDPIAVTFTLPERELGSLLAAQKSGDIKVSVTPPDSPAPLEGRVSFIDNTVDQQNGTIKIKASFPNGEQRLWPGQYLTVSTAVRELKDAIVVPQAAIITGIDTRSVYVVGSDHIAQARQVELVHAFGAQAAVSGVREGERIVVDGKQNLRSGTRVMEASADGKNGNNGNNGGASKRKS
jgi:RND family efflux transporter MFP subunit